MIAFWSVFIAGVVGYLLYRRWLVIRPGYDINIPAPAVKRTDLLFGYYGTMGDQVVEVKDHTNLHWELQFEGTEKLINNLKTAQCATIIDVSAQIMEKKAGASVFTVRADASQRLRDFLTELRVADVLKYITAITVVDEPNSTVGSVAEVEKATIMAARALHDFPELANVKLACIFAGAHPFHEYMSFFDWVGFDDYGKKSDIFEPAKGLYPGGTYARMKKKLLPNQRTIIVPGGCYGQDPVPFVNFAQSNPEVIAIVPFLWFDSTDPGVKAPGIRSGGIPGNMKQQYIDAGRSVVNR